jgi:hypothetical protein
MKTASGSDRPAHPAIAGGSGFVASRPVPLRRPGRSAATGAVVVGPAVPPRDSVDDRPDALRARRLILAAGLPVAAFAFAFALRAAFLGAAYDVHVDEVTYLFISRNMATGHGATLAGRPFFLHPPLFFILEALYLLITHPGGLIIEQVVAVRTLNVLLGAATALVLAGLVTRLAGRRLGLVACLLFSLDPFIIRMNSRNLLETAALLFVLLGYAVLLGDRAASVPRPWRVGLAGVLFGCALLTKEMTAFLTLLPMAVLFVTGWAWPRGKTVAIGAIAIAVYSLYPVAAIVSGLGPQFITEKLSGLLRFLGIVKTTGFVAGGPSFAGAVLRNIDVFATTYVLMAIGIPASLLLIWKGDRASRVIGLLGLSAYALLAYSIGFGTLEEQFFYFLVLPAMLSVPIAWSVALRLVHRSGPVAQGRLAGSFDRAAGRLVRVAALVVPIALILSLSWSSLVWAHVHLTPDDGYREVVSYLQRHVPRGSTIGVTAEPQEFVLQGYVILRVTSTTDLEASTIPYVVISTKQIADGYTHDGAAIYAWLRAHASRVFAFDGRTYGSLAVYRIGRGAPAEPGPRPGG